MQYSRDFAIVSSGMLAMVLAFSDYLLACERYVDEACADVRIFRCAQVKHIVHDAVAYVGACGEGYVARKAVFTDVLNHCFDRNRCKVCGRGNLPRSGSSDGCSPALSGFLRLQG